MVCSRGRRTSSRKTSLHYAICLDMLTPVPPFRLVVSPGNMRCTHFQRGIMFRRYLRATPPAKLLSQMSRISSTRLTSEFMRLIYWSRQSDLTHCSDQKAYKDPALFDPPMLHWLQGFSQCHDGARKLGQCHPCLHQNLTHFF